MKTICEKCNTIMIDKTKGPYIHLVCPNCGHSIATYDFTKDDPINFDETVYTIKSINNAATKETIKIISKINGYNSLNCREMILNNAIIFEGNAIEVVNAIKLLKESNIHFSISPDFNYEI